MLGITDQAALDRAEADIATGSAFTNGFARMLPGPYHVPPAFFFPQFIPLILMFYWLVRVRLVSLKVKSESPS